MQTLITFGYCVGGENGINTAGIWSNMTFEPDLVEAGTSGLLGNIRVFMVTQARRLSNMNQVWHENYYRSKPVLEFSSFFVCFILLHISGFYHCFLNLQHYFILTVYSYS